MPATINRLLIHIALFGAAASPVAGLCAPSDRDSPPRSAPTTIESTVIRPKSRYHCDSEDCGPVDRLTDEQLDRLRDLDNRYPREFIEFNPRRRDSQDRGRRRSN